MDFYNCLSTAKKTHKLTNTDLGRVLDMTGDTFRVAAARRRFTELEIRELKKYLDSKEPPLETEKPPQNGSSLYLSLKDHNDYLLKEIEFLREMLLKK
jgi:hypothetical protein